MENLLKKFVYTGVGLVSLTKDRLQKTVDELVDDKKISSKEGKKLVEDFFKDTESKRKELEGQLKKSVEKIIKTFSFATADEMAALESRIKELEAALAEEDNKTQK